MNCPSHLDKSIKKVLPEVIECVHFEILFSSVCSFPAFTELKSSICLLTSGLEVARKQGHRLVDF